jgi:predicted Fe-Mo cluster-binding NifX family protein
MASAFPFSKTGTTVMRIALTVWNGRISPVCDVARRLLIVELEAGKAVSRHEETFSCTEPGQPVKRLTDIQPAALICGAISVPLVEWLTASGIQVFPFIAGEVEDVIAAYVGGTLNNQALAMPGCRGRRRQCGRGGARCQGGRGGLRREAARRSALAENRLRESGSESTKEQGQ